MNSKILGIAAAAALAALPFAASAGSQQSQINVSASVPSNCTISGPGSTINLGIADPVGNNAPAAVNSAVSIACNNGTQYTVGLGATAGATPQGSQQMFAMSDGNGHSLSYNASLASYGATSSGSAAVSDALSLQIVGGQDAFVGNYSGSFWVTVSY